MTEDVDLNEFLSPKSVCVYSFSSRGLTLKERLLVRSKLHPIFSYDGISCRFWMGAKTSSTKVTELYGVIWNGERIVLVHRQSWIEHKGPIPTGMNVCHHCDHPLCIEPLHLFLGDHAANVADKIAKGRQPRGELVSQRNRGRRKGRRGFNRGARVLSDDAIETILAKTDTPTILAERYGVSRTAIYNVRSKGASI